jgi:hypothetical protein
MRGVRLLGLLIAFILLVSACKPTGEIQIGDFTWVDTNRNGIQDNGEGPLVNVRVDIYEKGGQSPLNTTRSDKDGLYGFSELAKGDYFLKFESPPVYAFTEKDQIDNKNDEEDSDAFSSGNNVGKTDVFTFDGKTNVSLDAGFYPMPTPTPTPAPVKRGSSDDPTGDVFFCFEGSSHGIELPEPPLDMPHLDIGEMAFEIVDDRFQVTVEFPSVEDLSQELQAQQYFGFLVLWDEDARNTPFIPSQGVFGIGSHQFEVFWDGSMFGGSAWQRMGPDFTELPDHFNIQQEGNELVIVGPPGFIPSRDARMGAIAQGLSECDAVKLDFSFAPNGNLQTGLPIHPMDPNWVQDPPPVPDFFGDAFFEDPLGDGRAPGGGPFDGHLPPEIDLTGFEVVEHPFAESFEFIFTLADLERQTAPIFGGLEVLYPGVPLATPLDPNWIHNNSGQNSINFNKPVNGNPQVYRALVMNGTWVPYSTTSTVVQDENMLYFHVPFEDIFPGPLGFDATTFYPFPTITNMMVIDDMGLPDDLSGLNDDMPFDGSIFADGFESGDTSAWSNSVP